MILTLLKGAKVLFSEDLPEEGSEGTEELGKRIEAFENETVIHLSIEFHKKGVPFEGGIDLEAIKHEQVKQLVVTFKS